MKKASRKRRAPNRVGSAGLLALLSESVSALFKLLGTCREVARGWKAVSLLPSFRLADETARRLREEIRKIRRDLNSSR
jgi:hypothetical protein